MSNTPFIAKGKFKGKNIATFKIVYKYEGNPISVDLKYLKEK